MSKSKNLVADLRADLEGMAVKLEMALADERRCEDQNDAAKRSNHPLAYWVHAP